jgi:hypothetical protein
MATLFQRSFAAGEIAPALHTRVDTIKYAYGLATQVNFYTGKAGGAINRPGLKSFLESKLPSQYASQLRSYKTKLIPVSGGAEETGIGDTVFIEIVAFLGTRFIVNGVPIKVGNGTFYNPLTQYYPGDVVRVTGVPYLCFRKPPTLGISPPNALYYKRQDFEDKFWPLNDVNAQYVQISKNILIGTPSYGIVEALDEGNGWYIKQVSGPNGSGLGPSISPPGGVAVSPSGSTDFYYVVTAISGADFEESVASVQVHPQDGEVSVSSPRTVTWQAVEGAYSYNVYRSFNSRFGLVATTPLTSFKDTFVTADYTEVPPELRTDLTLPSVIGYSQQRVLVGNTPENPSGVWASRVGSIHNFSRKFQGKADESASFKLNGGGAVRALLEVGKTWIFTAKAEYSCSAITRTGPEDLKKESENGSGSIPPIAIGQSALYIQTGDSIVRSIGFDQNGGGLDGYSEGDLTTYSSHLFEGHTIKSWAYQQRPDSLIWAVRDDGILLCLTFMKQENIIAWHRHTTDGFVEQVVARPEGLETAIYVTVLRVIDGVERRFIERLASRYPQDVKDFCFVDAAVTYDGRNKNPDATLKLTNGVAWDDTELMSLLATNFTFVSSDAGKEFHLFLGNETAHLTVDEVISNTEVTVRAVKRVPDGFRNVALTTFARTAQVVAAPLLNGRKVSVFADGFVVASVNNPGYAEAVVTNGSITLDRFYSVVHVGLPITADLETLDIDTAQAETTATKKINISQVTVALEKTRGGFVGAKIPEGAGVGDLIEMVPDKVNYEGPSGLRSGKLTQPIFGGWESNGRVAIRHVDPTPANILGIAPSGLMPFGG